MIHTILLDSRPPFAGDGHESLLGIPVGTGTLLDHMRARLTTLGPHPPVVATTFGPDDSSRQAAAARGGLLFIEGKRFHEWLEACEPSDWLLLVDPRCYAVEPLEPETLIRHFSADPRWVRHLVALDLNSAGTHERVQHDQEGRVRCIQRHYDAVTWPFTAGVACSLLPAACLMVAQDLRFGSLPELRQVLANRGVPSRDLPLRGEVLDFTQEADLLLLNERLVLAAAGADGVGVESKRPILVGAGHRIHPSARIVGPVVFQTNVTVEEGAWIVGPMLAGPRARIGPGAVVAQSLLGADTVVPLGGRVRHRVLLDSLHAASSLADRHQPAPLYRDRRHSVTTPAERIPRSSGRVSAVVEAILALLALFVLSPLLLLVALLVKVGARGPVLYGDKREGKNGRVFLCWKFRTMCAGAEERQQELAVLNQVDGPQFKIPADPRITRLGRWLRSTNIDELPQLINVARGEMSFVGPRPSPFRENQYCVAWREGRLSVRPGITGLWQVCRHERETGDFHQWIQYDLLYVRHHSLIVDLKIAMATILVVLKVRPYVPLAWVIPKRHLQAEG